MPLSTEPTSERVFVSEPIDAIRSHVTRIREALSLAESHLGSNLHMVESELQIAQRELRVALRWVDTEISRAAEHRR